MEDLRFYFQMALAFLAPAGIVYLAGKKMMQGMTLWLRIPLSILLYVFCFLVIVYGLLASGAIPFTR